jgi:hypothetical protein
MNAKTLEKKINSTLKYVEKESKITLTPYEKKRCHIMMKKKTTKMCFYCLNNGRHVVKGRCDRCVLLEKVIATSDDKKLVAQAEEKLGKNWTKNKTGGFDAWVQKTLVWFVDVELGYMFKDKKTKGKKTEKKGVEKKESKKKDESDDDESDDDESESDESDESDDESESDSDNESEYETESDEDSSDDESD